MSTYPHKQSQFELFPGSSNPTISPGMSRRPLGDLTLSPENLIVLCILLVMTFILAFSFGVERGKRLTKAAVTASLAERKINLAAEKEYDKMTPSLTLTESSSMVKTAGPDVRTQLPPADGESAEDRGNEKREVFPLLKEPSPTAENQYTIQVASFQNQESASEEAKRLEKIGYEIFVLPKGKYSIVCVGKFEKKEQANQFSRRLKSQYHDLLVRRF